MSELAEAPRLMPAQHAGSRSEGRLRSVRKLLGDADNPAGLQHGERKAQAYSRQPFFLYLYTDELPALREHLLANGVKVSEINRPPYMPSGEISVPDPDGYRVFVGQ